MSKIRVLIVDDSALMRKYLREILEQDPEIEVIAVARNGREAVEKALELSPDVITMDINMPEMDGLTAIQYIMLHRPTPIIVISSLTQKGALTTFEALELGAVDYVAKPDGTVSLKIKEVAEEILQKIKAVAKSRGVVRLKARKERPLVQEVPKTRPVSPNTGFKKLILIGVSTGGPKALMEIIPRLPGDLDAAVVIIQHMPENFTASFAARLNNYSELYVKEAEDGESLERGKVLVARGGINLKLERKLGTNVVRVRYTPLPRETIYWPSVDVAFRSALTVIEPHRIIAVLLTGMGDDGAQAMVEIKQKGGYTIAESEETAVVWGMPREAIERGGATEVLPVYQIADRLVELVR
ncbi:Bifunctional protein GlmU [Carboxydothermus islandicus]|uniref:Protein-glutamate methylesterase/protein-glutamine glutaminase n=1 Tax=Carboxydothermus islandicus TaxID=661089 RepID=A0A1L8D526_9THEO|nr:chemotaxis response regulator protein-glutamate methylesterase [Carboxydothermus islandicus]GAV26197.1 Bifunctional protein GlmU [Carboxydothermus islandicus]